MTTLHAYSFPDGFEYDDRLEVISTLSGKDLSSLQFSVRQNEQIDFIGLTPEAAIDLRHLLEQVGARCVNEAHRPHLVQPHHMKTTPIHPSRLSHALIGVSLAILSLLVFPFVQKAISGILLAL